MGSSRVMDPHTATWAQRLTEEQRIAVVFAECGKAAVSTLPLRGYSWVRMASWKRNDSAVGIKALPEYPFQLNSRPGLREPVGAPP